MAGAAGFLAGVGVTTVTWSAFQASAELGIAVLSLLFAASSFTLALLRS
jgi:hypothetical protein